MDNKMEKRRLITERDNELTNQLCFQQAVLIALINNYYDITIKKPTRDSLVTNSIPKITAISNGNEQVDIRKISENLVSTRISNNDMKNLQKKTIQRRNRKNILTYINNYLIDLLREEGYFFNSKYSKKSEKTYQLERINEIFYENELLFNLNDIFEKGQKINNYLIEICKQYDYFVIPKGNVVLNDIIYN